MLKLLLIFSKSRYGGGCALESLLARVGAISILRVHRLCVGSNPPFGIILSEHEKHKSSIQAPQKQKLLGPPFPPAEHNTYTTERQDDTFLHAKCVLCVSELPNDLALVVESWQRLPEAVRVGIVAMIQAARE